MYKKVTIEKMSFPVNEYIYNAMSWFSLDEINWYHCGFGKYCKTLKEAQNYKKLQEMEE